MALGGQLSGEGLFERWLHERYSTEEIDAAQQDDACLDWNQGWPIR
ncbi:MAG: hypothetical protein IPO99_16065 [Nitrospira sp.]|nr:hypothetical protein [Nitrospira sp.]